MVTANVPPMPKLGRLVLVKNNMPIKPIATVMPLKKTALPAVATLMAVAVRISSGWREISSRKRFTMNKE